MCATEVMELGLVFREIEKPVAEPGPSPDESDESPGPTQALQDFPLIGGVDGRQDAIFSAVDYRAVIRHEVGRWKILRAKPLIHPAVAREEKPTDEDVSATV